MKPLFFILAEPWMIGFGKIPAVFLLVKPGYR
jgi:hypothetical protein